MDQDILFRELSALDRWCAGDPMGWVELSGENIIYIEPQLTCPITGCLEFRSNLNSFAGKSHSPRQEVLSPRFVSRENTLLLSYIVVFVNTEAWNVTSVYFKQANEWKLAHSHRSLLNHTQPAFTEIPIPVKNGEQKYDGVLGVLMSLESKAMERWRKGDPYGFIEISATDVTYFDTGTRQRIDGRDALAAEYALREGKIFYDVMDFIDPMVLVQDETAILVYRFLSTWLNPDGSVARRIPWNCTEVYQRYIDRWMINHTHWSIIHGTGLEG